MALHPSLAVHYPAAAAAVIQRCHPESACHRKAAHQRLTVVLGKHNNRTRKKKKKQKEYLTTIDNMG